MKIAIHHRPGSFSKRWIEYCKERGISTKIVNCYDSNITEQVQDCDGLMWHFHQANPKDVLFAKQLIYSLQMAGKKVFPNFQTCWHFDDKVGQKYLLESIDAPLVPSYVFYDKQTAFDWIEQAEFPKVFKLRRGSGSDHVRLVPDKKTAKGYVKKAFSKGFSQYDALSNLKERWRKFRKGKVNAKSVLKGIIRLGYTTNFAKVIGNEKGYIYFQDFIAGNDHDIRVNVVDGKAFAVKRMVRENDFRASGSGYPYYEKHHFSERAVKIAQGIARELNLQAVAFDFLQKDGEFLISELSYGFCDMTRGCPGYWDEDLNWHEESFFEEDWMLERMLKEDSADVNDIILGRHPKNPSSQQIH